MNNKDAAIEIINGAIVNNISYADSGKRILGEGISFRTLTDGECIDVADQSMVSLDTVRSLFLKMNVDHSAKRADELLIEMGETFRERNKVYGDNYKRVGDVMVAMFPDGIVLKTAEDFNRWHLWELQIVKLTRFAVSGLTHIDSIHDCSVYGAMVESLINENTTPIKGVK